MLNNDNIETKSFLKHAVLAFIVFLILLFGNCTSNNLGLAENNSNCGVMYKFKHTVINLFIFNYEGNYLDVVMRISLILLLIISTITALVSLLIAYKFEDTEEYTLLAKRMINFSFATFLLAVIITFLLSSLIITK